MSCKSATWTPLCLWGPTLPRPLRDFAFRESATPSLLLLGTPNAGIPIFWIRATCPRSDRRSRLNRGIALRDSDVHGIIALADPDSPICDVKGVFCASAAETPRSSFHCQWCTRVGALLDQLRSSILLPEGLLRPPPSSCATGAKVLDHTFLWPVFDHF